MELDPVYAIPGFIVASLLVILFCNPCNKGFSTLQRGEELIKLKCGKETSLCCKWFWILVLMPLYFITVWMAFVAIGGDVGMSIINQVCAEEDEGCRAFFSLGLTMHDDDACVLYVNCTCPPGSADDCNDDDLFARSGSSHLGFAPNLGLGQDLVPIYETVDYECDDDCDDIVTACNPEDSCVEWSFDTQDIVEFSIGDCVCTDGGDGSSCTSWTCDEVVMPYFYPNIVFCILVSLLYLLPVMLYMAENIKMQLLKKVCPCKDPTVLWVTQGGGVELTEGGALATGVTGGHAQNMWKDKEFQIKVRSFSRYDCAVYVFGTLIIVLSTYFMWVAAGFLSIVMLMGVVLVILIRHTVLCVLFFIGRDRRTRHRGQG